MLLSTYDLGRQPFGLASPAAWLRGAGLEVAVQDLAIEALDPERVRRADVVAFHLPMHTATRISAELIPRVRAINPAARLICYGLYAPLNAGRLRALGVEACIGGEFEAALVEAVRGRGARTRVVLDRLDFLVPDRAGLPPLADYAHLELGEGQTRVVGYTEASRGCKHLCRHCPVVPVYEGRFRILPVDVVLEDIRRQVAAGAEHISFGDPDFLNGPGHALAVARAMHAAFPQLSWDATIKVEHLVRHAELLPELRAAGCILITSAVEAVDAAALEAFDKRHTPADLATVVEACRAAGIALNPTFVAFHPWLTLEGYRELLRTLAALDLVDSVAPVQLAIRLLLPAGSKLLELPEVAALAEAFDPEALVHSWRHPDPRVDALQRVVEDEVAASVAAGRSRRATFARLWRLASDALGEPAAPLPSGAAELARLAAGDLVSARAPIPYLSEPWYC